MDNKQEKCKSCKYGKLDIRRSPCRICDGVHGNYSEKNFYEERKEGTSEQCPFCGSRHTSVDEAVEYWIYCEDCYAVGPPAETKKEAVVAWNRRAV